MKFEEKLAVRAAKTVYRDGKRVIKLFNEDYSKAAVLNEALNQALVEETGLAIPRLLEVTKVDGLWAIVMEYIEGKTLEVHLREEPERRAEWLSFFVDLQIEMHAKRAPLLKPLIDKMQRKISESPLDATTRYDLHTRLDSMKRHKKVCHGDFNPSNIIISDAGAAYIIDWAHATQGNASADAARTYLLFALDGENALAEDYLKLFCNKSDTARQYVEKWMPIVAASQMVKGKSEQTELLRRWTDVVEYE